MPSTPTINLDIRIGGSSDPGWTNVIASNSQTYGYLFTGGDDDHGGLIQEVGTPRDTAPLQLIADPRYLIAGSNFTGDAQQQLTFSAASDQRSATVVDSNSAIETAEYEIQVSDSTAGCTLACDPIVNNKPKK